MRMTGAGQVRGEERGWGEGGWGRSKSVAGETGSFAQPPSMSMNSAGHQGVQSQQGSAAARVNKTNNRGARSGRSTSPSKKTTVASRSFPQNQHGSGTGEADRDSNTVMDQRSMGQAGRGGSRVYQDRTWNSDGKAPRPRSAEGKFLPGHNVQMAHQGALLPADLAAKAPTGSASGHASSTKSRMSPKRSRVGGEDGRSVVGVSSQAQARGATGGNKSRGEMAGRTTPPLSRNGTPPLPNNDGAEPEDGPRAGSVWRKPSGELCNEVILLCSW